jgi:sugar phosphate isomerase/epimerase
MNCLCGFADEAADGLAGQIQATKALGWEWIEARSVDGVNLHDMDEKAFDDARRALDGAEIRVICLGSTIANWGKSVDEDFSLTIATTKRAVARMRLLGTSLVRIMSYSIIRDGEGGIARDQKKEERFRRLREICARFLDAGMTPVHENCFNYGGMSPEHTLELLGEVPGLKLVFDTGNPSLTADFRRDRPWPNQDPREAYLKLREYIVHVHVKDGERNPATEEERYYFPDEGVCGIPWMIENLLATGYRGAFSIEPHMGFVFHDANAKWDEKARFENYVEYGRRFERILAEADRRALAGGAAR